MDMKDLKKKMEKGIGLLFMMAALASCSMMEDDRTDCPTGLYVNFKYDYNMQRADMFKDQVGWLRLYVVDADGKLVEQQEVSNLYDGDALRTYGYQMHLPSLKEGTYSLYADAFQKDYAETQEGNGAKYHLTELKKDDDISHLQATLDSKEQPDVDGRYEVEQNALPLDTLWKSLGNIKVTVKEGAKPSTVTVPLIRDTKRLNISLRQLENPLEIKASDFDYYITDNNGLLAYNNDVVEDKPLIYKPYRKWTTVEEVTPNEKRNAAHAELNFNRLIDHNDAKKDARLVIQEKATGTKILDINLPAYLSEGRGAFEMENYSEQEYLDRQHDYTLDLYLQGSKWVYMDIKVLSWSVRIQNIDL